MRSVILFSCFILFAFSATGQTELRYVWAKSGLTLRAEGRAGAEKTGVIPYGAAVRLTGEEGEHAEVEVLRALSIGPEVQSKPWSMSANYLEVEWNGEKGWMYGGYLVRFLVPQRKSPSVEEWLEDIGGTPDTLLNDVRLPDFGGYQSLYRYRNGISRTEERGEGWGATTIVIPLTSLSHGYLIADEFYQLSGAMEEYRNEENIGIDPAVLSSKGDDHLLFEDELGRIEIRRIGAVLVITSEGGC
ncbi:hypothetical protein FUA23_01415 [Neolewinella aurantiaca]|uniref:SH3b domain-containing protein n=1 Tax=Neolewinella aurantiaca TaxID=2602767 RepID=A0A5C7FY01_9BACT|nr:hypothetical protein [Neolewinella aurantiaca]TXF91383.1 hypothetical protein FUA23_01415 [Neolewinella aurantiaca]